MKILNTIFNPPSQGLCLIVKMHELCGLCGGLNFVSKYGVFMPFFFQTAENQNLLCRQEAVPTLAALLCSPHYKVQMPSLCCLANMCFQNQKVSAIVATSRCKFLLHSAYINRTTSCMCDVYEPVHKQGMPVAVND
jgi:hypothetical protein